MKIAAIILLLSFIAFVSEAVILPFKNIANDKKTVHHCCSQCKMMQHKNQSQKETTKKGCNQSCIDCPVFAVFYPDYARSEDLISLNHTSHFTFFFNGFISIYAGKTWKPPNNI